MKDLAIHLSIVGRSVCCAAALYFAWRLADAGKDGWGWLLVVAVLIGCYSVKTSE